MTEQWKAFFDSIMLICKTPEDAKEVFRAGINLRDRGEPFQPGDKIKQLGTGFVGVVTKSSLRDDTPLGQMVVYEAELYECSKIFDGQLDEHVVGDAEDPQTLTLLS